MFLGNLIFTLLEILDIHIMFLGNLIFTLLAILDIHIMFSEKS